MGEDTAVFPLPSDASCENEIIFEHEITNAHSTEQFTAMDVPNFCHDTSEEDVIIEEEVTENQLPHEVAHVDNEIEMDPKLPVFHATLGEPEGVTGNPNCFNVHTNSEIQIQNIGNKRINAVDILIQDDPCSFGSVQTLSDSRHESLPIIEDTTFQTGVEMKREVETKPENEMNTAAAINTENQVNNSMHQDIDVNHGIHYDEVREASSHSDPQAPSQTYCVFNPDQDVPTLVSTVS